jgi:hypothetical protein
MIKPTTLLLALIAALTLSCSHSDDDNGPILPGGDEDDRVLNTPTPTATKPTTTTTRAPRYPSVAGNGILWKPVADSGGKLVVLLNRSYGKPAVKIKNRNNQLVASGDFVYFSNPDRATYRFSISGAELERRYGSVYLIIGSKVFLVPQPSRRYE